MITEEQVNRLCETVIDCADEKETTDLGNAIVSLFNGYSNGTIQIALAFALAEVMSNMANPDLPKGIILAIVAKLALNMERSMDNE
jgi:hypothetical protein